jgi:hypothetical protein
MSTDPNEQQPSDPTTKANQPEALDDWEDEDTPEGWAGSLSLDLGDDFEDEDDE